MICTQVNDQKNLCVLLVKKLVIIINAERKSFVYCFQTGGLFVFNARSFFLNVI